MRFLKYMLWLLVAMFVVYFVRNNWNETTVHLFNETVLETKLPALLLIAFLLGFVPLYISHRTHRWRNKRRLASLRHELQLAQAGYALPKNDEEAEEEEQQPLATDAEPNTTSPEKAQ